MNTANQETIQAYEGHVQEYIQGTPPSSGEGVVKEWIGQAIAGLPKDARILELGSATGRDAAYLQSLGYTVDCTDATQAFVDLLNQKGFNARNLNAITDDLGGPYDLILANAVLLHFTRDQMRQVLHKSRGALVQGGRLAFTVKQGEGEEWSDKKLGVPRYFCYWTAPQLGEYLKEAGFVDSDIKSDQSTPSAAWVQVIAKK